MCQQKQHKISEFNAKFEQAVRELMMHGLAQDEAEDVVAEQLMLAWDEQKANIKQTTDLLEDL